MSKPTPKQRNYTLPTNKTTGKPAKQPSSTNAKKPDKQDNPFITDNPDETDSKSLLAQDDAEENKSNDTPRDPTDNKENGESNINNNDNEKIDEEKDEEISEKSVNENEAMKLAEIYKQETDFSTEYEEIKSDSGPVIDRLTNAVNTLQSNLNALEEEGGWKVEGRLKDTIGDVDQTKKIIMAIDKCLKEDYIPRITELKELLKSLSVKTKVKLEEYKKPERSTEGEANTEIKLTRAEWEEKRREIEQQKDLATLARELIEMELRIQELSNDIAIIGEEIDKSIEEAVEVTETLNETDEQVAAELEAERKKREEEEAERKKKEEEERKKEEERKAEEEKKKKEEEERLRQNDSRYFPNSMIYETLGEPDVVGQGVKCVVRSPEGVEVSKDDVTVKTRDLVKHRYHAGDGEELVSNMVTIKPADRKEKEFKNGGLWIAIPFSGSVRNKDVVVKVQQYQKITKTVSVKKQVKKVKPQKAEEKHEPDEEKQNAEKENEENENQDDTAAEPAKEGDENENETSQEDKQEKDEKINDEVQLEEDDKNEEVEEESEYEEIEVEEEIFEEIKTDFNDEKTKETTVEGYEGVRFAEVTIFTLPEKGLTLLVVIKPKREIVTVNNKGGAITSTIDPRNIITIPKNAFRLSTVVQMQVIPIDAVALNGLKERYDGCDDVLGTSPMIQVQFPTRPIKYITYNITNPSGGSKTKPVAKAGEKRGSLPSVNKGVQSQGPSVEHIDFVNLVVKDERGRWVHPEKAELNTTKDVTIFKLSDPLQKLILLRTKVSLESDDLCSVASKLEKSLSEKTVQLLVRQNVDHVTQITLECCRKENIDKAVHKYEEENYADGPEPGPKVSLREGDIIKVTFRDNINFTDGDAKLISYNSNLSSAVIRSEIKEVDPYAQHGLDTYRGHVMLTLEDREYEAPPRFAQPVDKKRKLPPGFLCEVPVMLPKPEKEESKVRRANFTIQPDGPLSEEYFDELSLQLSDVEWPRVAAGLRHNQASIQRIQQYNVEKAQEGTDEYTRACAKQMLINWFKVSQKSKHKVDELVKALREGGRADLGERLAERYRQMVEEETRLARAELLEKCTKAYTQSQAALKTWRPVAMSLGLSSADIAEIGGSPLVEQLNADQAREMLARWQETRGEAATRDSLLVVLQKLKLHDAASAMTLAH